MSRRTALSVIVMICYLAAIMGLDIHHDAEHGKTYVMPALLAQSCEMIHPHEHCHDSEAACCCCCDSGCEEDEDCCTDDFESVSITGTDSGSQVFQHFQPLTGHTVFTPVVTKAYSTVSNRSANAAGPPPESRDISVRNCVMRA